MYGVCEAAFSQTCATLARNIRIVHTLVLKLSGPYIYGHIVCICPYVFTPYMGRSIRGVYLLVVILSGPYIYGQNGIYIPTVCFYTISGPEYRVRL